MIPYTHATLSFSVIFISEIYGCVLVIKAELYHLYQGGSFGNVCLVICLSLWNSFVCWKNYPKNYVDFNKKRIKIKVKFAWVSVPVSTNEDALQNVS